MIQLSKKYAPPWGMVEFIKHCTVALSYAIMLTIIFLNPSFKCMSKLLHFFPKQKVHEKLH